MRFTDWFPLTLFMAVMISLTWAAQVGPFAWRADNEVLLSPDELLVEQPEPGELRPEPALARGDAEQD